MSQNAWQASMRFSLALTSGTHWTRAYFRVTMSLIDQRMVDLSSEPDFRMLRRIQLNGRPLVLGAESLDVWWMQLYTDGTGTGQGPPRALSRRLTSVYHGRIRLGAACVHCLVF